MYHKIDPGSYRPDKYEVEGVLCPSNNMLVSDSKCQYTQEQYEEASKKLANRKAEDSGRYIGSWMGFLLGFLVLANKASDIYKNLRT